MPIKVVMPQLGESIVEGTVTKWLKQEGETIEEFEPLLEVNTDKVDTEIPSPVAGSLLKVYVAEGQTVRAGTVLAMLGEPGESVPDRIEERVETKQAAVEQVAQEAPSTVDVTQRSAPVTRKAEIGFISPVVARIAAQHGVDLRKVQGSGRKGRITKKDVLAYVQQATQAPWEEPASGELFRPTEEIFGTGQSGVGEEGAPKMVPGTVLPIDVVRKSIAEHMVRSRRTSAHVTTVVEADLSRVVAHRKRINPALSRKA